MLSFAAPSLFERLSCSPEILKGEASVIHTHTGFDFAMALINIVKKLLSKLLIISFFQVGEAFRRSILIFANTVIIDTINIVKIISIICNENITIIFQGKALLWGRSVGF